MTEGMGGPISAGKSTVDHDKWLQVGFRSRFKQRGEHSHTHPTAKNYTDTLRVVPKWPRGCGRRSDDERIFFKIIHATAQDTQQPPHFNAFNKHATSDGSPSIYATSRPPESGTANLAVASGYFFDMTQHSDTSSLAKRATSAQTTALRVKNSRALGGELTGDICKNCNRGGTTQPNKGVTTTKGPTAATHTRTGIERTWQHRPT